jgi:stress response protein YsnF
MIIPVLHEQPVLLKKVVLTEEIRITRVTREVRQPQTVTVKVEEVSLVHQDDDESATPSGQGGVAATLDAKRVKKGD